MTWDGNGPAPAFTLDDDEVLSLVRTGTIALEVESPEFVPAVTAWRKLQMRAEDILNEQRAAGRVDDAQRPGTLAYAEARAESDGSLDGVEDGYDGPIPTDPALDTGCDGCE